MKYILFFLLIISFNLYGEEKNLIFGDIKIDLNNEISRNEISKLNLEDIAVLRNGIYRDWETDRKSTRLNSSHITRSRMPSSA